MTISAAARKMIIAIGISSLIIIIIGAVFYSEQILPFTLGVILMAGLNVFKVLSLERAVNKAVDMTKEKSAGNYIRVQFLLRYILTAAVLVIAAFVPFIDILGAAAGVFTYQIAVFCLKEKRESR